MRFCSHLGYFLVYINSHLFIPTRLTDRLELLLNSSIPENDNYFWRYGYEVRDTIDLQFGYIFITQVKGNRLTLG